jgi:ribonuclease VapC
LIIDTSAVIAVLRKEHDHLRYRQAFAESPECRMSTATYLETAIIADRDGSPLLSREFDRVITLMEVELVPVSVQQVQIARAAYRDFGKGSGHPARLNFGDCFAYALAIERGEPLLYKGGDFSRTDVRDALG